LDEDKVGEKILLFLGSNGDELSASIGARVLGIVKGSRPLIFLVDDFEALFVFEWLPVSAWWIFGLSLGVACLQN